MLFTTIFIAFWVALVWFGICNQRTCNQRNRIIDVIYAQEDWRAARSAYQSVDYDTHLWYLFTFRNPAQLYPALLQVALK